MISARRWVQVTDLEPYNPYQRRRIVPAFGTDEGNSGMFMWNPAPMTGIQVFSGASPLPASTGKILAGLGVVLGVVGGVMLAHHGIKATKES
jgi:hypothetical protein